MSRIARVALMAAVILLTFIVAKPKPGWIGHAGVIGRGLILGGFIGWQIAEHYRLAARWNGKAKRQ